MCTDVIKITISEIIDRSSFNSYENKYKSIYGNKILLYGAGAFGKEILTVLQKNNLDVRAFLDRNAQEISSIKGIPVYLPENEIDPSTPRDSYIVILSIVLTEPSRKEIISYLNNLGYHTIIDAQRLRAEQVPYDLNHNKPMESHFMQEKEDIIAAFSLFVDDHSKDIFTSFLSSHIKRNYEKSIESIGTTQYFSPKLPIKLNYSRFIDCGAYHGDTLESLINLFQLEAYAGFEPGRASFFSLTETADQLSENILCCLYPCAVGGKTGFEKFNDIPGSGCIDNSGDDIVLVVRLDDVLKNFRPTMIKMDIEGEEYNALQGAREMISQSRPDLAICVYHYISDLWRIPNLIKSWDLGYEFFLRTHSSATMETVLYASVRKGDKFDGNS